MCAQDTDIQDLATFVFERVGWAGGCRWVRTAAGERKTLHSGVFHVELPSEVDKKDGDVRRRHA
jgi:hypothetical protein